MLGTVLALRMASCNNAKAGCREIRRSATGSYVGLVAGDISVRVKRVDFSVITRTNVETR